MKMEIKTITPDLAFSWLQKNRDNRKVRVTWVRQLTGIIQRGEFKLTHQGIAFSSTGRLLDGQHRLLAIVDAGIPVEMVVSWNVDESAFDSLDVGQKRSFSDMYGADSLTTGVSRFIASTIHEQYSPSQQHAIHKIVQPVMYELRQFCSTNKRGITVAAVHTAATIRMLIDEDREYIKLLYWNLVHVKHSELPPIGRLLVDQIYGSLAGSGTGGKGNDLFARALKVFDKENAQLRGLRVPDTGPALQTVRDVMLPLLKLEKKPTSKASAATRAKSAPLSHVRAA